MQIDLALVAAVAIVISGCASTSTNSEPASFPLSCSASQDAGECLRTVSEFCGERGYDLFDASGKAISVAELRYVKATARCRTPDAN